MKFKYSWLAVLFLGLTACDINNDLDPIPEDPAAAVVELNGNGIDFSNYVSVGASFTAGFTDNALFIAAQENSFPNILAQKFAMVGGGTFTQPLMSDNIGGLLLGGTVIQGPRLIFNGSGPASLSSVNPNAIPTTDVTSPVGEHNNYGIPGAKSFHFLTPGYGAISGLLTNPITANPYFVRMNPSQPTVLLEAASKQPSFFTLSEIGGNDVLGYALAGGVGVDQTGNLDPSTYGGADITDPNVFANVFNGMVTTLTANGAKGVVGNLPYITSLAHFTTVPHNPLDPSNPDFGSQIPTLNTVYGAINQIFTAVGETDRIIQFSTEQANPVVIFDEDLTDLSATITGGLLASGADFEAFVQQFGLPVQAAPLVANLLGTYYGQVRPATENDLLVLPSKNVIGTVNEDSVAVLMGQGLPEALANQFSAEGVTKPLEDKWVLTPQEQMAVKTATDAYNTTIEGVVAANANVTLVDLNGILQTASTVGVPFDGYVLSTNLVTGGLVSLDGVHLTARGYALMANKMLEAIDTEFGSNFSLATEGLAKASNYPTNYSPTLQ